MKKHPLVTALILLLLTALFSGIFICIRFIDKSRPVDIPETETELQAIYYVPDPDIDAQLLTVNEWSRPGLPTSDIKNIVIHYLGNPGTTAQENRDFFEDLKDYQTDYMSANYIIGLEGEIIQCVPDGEIAYASNDANDTSISIENCHMDESGRFLKKTYISLVHLTAYLLEKYHLSIDDVIRHHDVTGKQCPAFYVEHEEAWEVFKEDVTYYYELSKQSDPDALATVEFRLRGIGYTYLSKADAQNTIQEETEVPEDESLYDEPYDYYSDSGYDEYWYDDQYYDDGYSETYWDDYYEESYYEDPYDMQAPF